jgi:hypothetical protein
MLLKFYNPFNGRYYYMFQHYEGDKPVLTIVRGGKKRKAIENYFYDNLGIMQKEIDRRKKRRIQRGYFQDKS